MGPIGTNWPTMDRGEDSTVILRPRAKFRNGQGREAREAKARAKLEAEIAALDADKARADLTRACAKRASSREWVSLSGARNPVPPKHYEITKRK